MPSLRVPKETKAPINRLSDPGTSSSAKGPDLQALSAALGSSAPDLDSLRQLCLDESIILSGKQLMPVAILGEGAFGIVWQCVLHPRDQPPVLSVAGGGAPATLEGLLGASSIMSPTGHIRKRSGVFGERPSSPSTSKLRYVALKHVKFPSASADSSSSTIRQQQVSKSLELFSRELLSLKALSHRNVVSYVGAVLYRCADVEDEADEDGGGRKMLAIVQEYAPWGSLAPLFRDKVAWGRKFSTGDGLRWAHHIAQGMAYLHGCKPPIMHRDIKPENVLLCVPNASAKLCDFGICAFDRNNKNAEADDGYFKSIDPFGLKAGRVWHSETKLLGDVNQTGQVGSLRYMAPENFKGRPYSYKTDVYSFAILLYELLMREKAYGGLFLNGEQIAELASSARAQRPALPPRWPAEAKELLNACWDADPAKRPEFTAIANQLAKWRADPSDKVLAQIWAASPLPAPERIKAAVSGAATQYAARWSAKPMPPGSEIVSGRALPVSRRGARGKGTSDDLPASVTM